MNHSYLFRRCYSPDNYHKEAPICSRYRDEGSIVIYQLFPDINECDEGRDDCSDDAECTNTDGSYYCTCNTGFTGDGRECMGMCVFIYLTHTFWYNTIVCGCVYIYSGTSLDYPNLGGKRKREREIFLL